MARSRSRSHPARSRSSRSRSSRSSRSRSSRSRYSRSRSRSRPKRSRSGSNLLAGVRGTNGFQRLCNVLIDKIVGGTIGFLPSGDRGGLLLLSYWLIANTQDEVNYVMYKASQFWRKVPSSEKNKWNQTAMMINSEAAIILDRHGV